MLKSVQDPFQAWYVVSGEVGRMSLTKRVSEATLSSLDTGHGTGPVR